jgi:hypothetical protein
MDSYGKIGSEHRGEGVPPPVHFIRGKTSEKNKERDAIYNAVSRTDWLPDGTVRYNTEFTEGDDLSDSAAEL